MHPSSPIRLFPRNNQSKLLNSENEFGRFKLDVPNKISVRYFLSVFYYYKTQKIERNRPDVIIVLCHHTLNISIMWHTPSPYFETETLCFMWKTQTLQFKIFEDFFPVRSGCPKNICVLKENLKFRLGRSDWK